MIKAKAKDKRHPKIINQWMVYEGINEINSVFGVLIAFKSYMRSEDFNKYHGEVIIESLQTLLCHGTQRIEEWMEIEEEPTK
jgi:hypothetical protein